MKPMHRRNTKPPSPEQKVASKASLDPELLLDAEYITRLRPTSRSELDGLVIGDPKAFSVTLGFEKGGWVVSKAAQAALTGDEVWVAMLKHLSDDWGNVEQETAEANFLALEHGGELRSAYYTSKGVLFTIVTNAARTRTAIQLEREYSV